MYWRIKEIDSWQQRFMSHKYNLLWIEDCKKLRDNSKIYVWSFGYFFFSLLDISVNIHKVMKYFCFGQVCDFWSYRDLDLWPPKSNQIFFSFFGPSKIPLRHSWDIAFTRMGRTEDGVRTRGHSDLNTFDHQYLMTFSSTPCECLC